MPAWRGSRHAPQESVVAIYQTFTTLTETLLQFDCAFMTVLGILRIFSVTNPEAMPQSTTIVRGGQP